MGKDEADTFSSDLGGSSISLITYGLLYSAGLFQNNQHWRHQALTGLEAFAFSQLFTGLAKEIFGRRRPEEHQGRWEWFKGEDSFPSGHGSRAFALATILSDTFNNRWVTLAAYTYAGLVGISRIEKDRHWPSDIVGSAILGITIGKVLTSMHKKREAAREDVRAWRLSPWFDREVAWGIKLSLRLP